MWTSRDVMALTDLPRRTCKRVAKMQSRGSEQNAPRSVESDAFDTYDMRKPFNIPGGLETACVLSAAHTLCLRHAQNIIYK